MTKKGIWSDAKDAALREAAEASCMATIERCEQVEHPVRGDVFNYTFADLPADLVTQRETGHTHSLGQDPSQLPSASNAR
jgi:TPP-dependent pyruvate/acetoin dehydrogenase alpha subunit